MPVVGTGGSTGQAPNTLWMSYLADRLTLMSQRVEGTALWGVTPPTPCNFVNQFLAVRSSFGAFATAPDGTTNVAQKIVEDTSNNTHYVSGGYFGGGSAFPIMRMAGFFKAAGRTRVAFLIGDAVFADGAFAGFDLSGVQNAYSGTFGTAGRFVIKGQSITSVGNGWCLCTFDVLINAVAGSGFFCRAELDNGSGTAASSATYTGDGSSGVLGWRHSVLPLQAWSIGGVAHFDDFLDPTLSKFDVNNTKAPGFTYYVDQGWPNWLASGLSQKSPIAPGNLVVSGSVLRIKSQTPPVGSGEPSAMGMATFLGSGQYVGRGFKPPVYVETMMSDAGKNTLANATKLGWWHGSLEAMASLTNPVIRFLQLNNMSGSTWESDGLNGGSAAAWTMSYEGFTQLSGAEDFHNVAFGYPEVGCFPFNANAFYLANINALASGGNFYQNGADYHPGSTALPPNPPWNVYTYSGGGIGDRQPTFICDMSTTFHNMARLFVPYDRVTGSPGASFTFFDGIPTASVTWRPGTDAPPIQFDGSNTVLHTTDWQQLHTFWQAGIITGSGQDLLIDFIRISQ